MKVTIVARVSVAARPAEVFTYLSVLKHHQLWNPHLLTVSSKSKLKEGMTYHTTHILLGVHVKAANKVVRLVAAEEVEIENTTGPLHYLVNYRVQPAENDSTQVVCNTTVEAKSEAFAFSAPVLKLLARREMQTDLQALKIAVEQKLA